ncbi:MAG: TRAP transporter substrate-binding protein DctP [Treponema sp.]|jgi:TRAP-type C4-dicarboxylate transport system substrate-binding protein|nr:TRAP transporter substrate-binding protein DctP [Treponema sp.]
MQIRSFLRFAAFVAAMALIFAVSPLFAQRKITIKLASLVPENTPWGMVINRMSTEWSQATGGEVELAVYHNGVAGDETEVLRKLRMNQIQAAVFTSIGLNSVTPEILTLSYPFLIRTDQELNAVLGKLKPELDAKMQQNGFVTLAWARAGWIKVFSRSPVYVPSDMRKLKVSASPSELEMIQAFKTMGYQIVPLNLNDILVSLNSGMVDVVWQSPIAVAGYQIFGVAKNMSSINVAPFMGGILMNNTAWRRIPDRHKSRLMAICKRIETEIEGSISKLEAEAISTMKKYGLTVCELSPRQTQEWYEDMGRYESNLAGPVFNRELYHKIKAILEDHRRGR